VWEIAPYLAHVGCGGVDSQAGPDWAFDSLAHCGTAGMDYCGMSAAVGVGNTIEEFGRQRLRCFKERANWLNAAQRGR
jgi:hypothetical protein